MEAEDHSYLKHHGAETVFKSFDVTGEHVSPFGVCVGPSIHGGGRLVGGHPVLYTVWSTEFQVRETKSKKCQQ